MGFSELQNKLNEVIGFVKAEGKKKKLPSKNKTRRLGVFGCLHVPRHSEKNVVRAVEWFKDLGVDTLVIGGDFLDCLAAVHAGHRINIRPDQWVSLQEEMATGKAVLEYLADSFDSIEMMDGNHPERPRKRLIERLDPSLMFLFHYLKSCTHPKVYDIIGLLTHDFENIKHIQMKDPDGLETHWLHQIGDLRICHSEKSGTIEGRAVNKLSEQFYHWDAVLGLAPWRVLIEIHTHNASMFPINNGDKLLIEGGCLCRGQQYSLEGKLPYKHPQQNFATYIQQNDGVTDINATRYYIFEGME